MSKNFEWKNDIYDEKPDASGGDMEIFGALPGILPYYYKFIGTGIAFIPPVYKYCQLYQSTLVKLPNVHDLILYVIIILGLFMEALATDKYEDNQSEKHRTLKILILGWASVTMFGIYIAKAVTLLWHSLFD